MQPSHAVETYAHEHLEKVFNDDQVNALIRLVSINRLAPQDNIAEPRETINALPEAHKQSDKRMTRLEGMVGEIVEIHKRSEKRLTCLEETVGELVDAHKRSEKRLTRLEGIVEELAEAQNRTTVELQTLVREHKKTRQQLGGLSMTVGYTLENEAYKALPDLLQRDHKISVQGRLIRCYVQDRYDDSLEVNIFGQGKRGDTTVTILGESKSQLSRNKIDAFLNKRLERFRGVFEEIVPVLVTHMISSPDVEEYARDQGIVLYYSYDF